MHPPRILLGVNIDHIATLRQARGTRYPDPVQAALLAEEAGADGITVHLREDRRHIQPRDVRLLAEVLNTRMNLEMAVTEEMLALAEEVRPAHVCLVPEKREELTTEASARRRYTPYLWAWWSMRVTGCTTTMWKPLRRYPVLMS